MAEETEVQSVTSADHLFLLTRHNLGMPGARNNRRIDSMARCHSFYRGVWRADVDDPKVVNGVHRFICFIGNPQTTVVLVEDEVLSFISSVGVWEVVHPGVKTLRTAFLHNSPHCVQCPDRFRLRHPMNHIGLDMKRIQQ